MIKKIIIKKKINNIENNNKIKIEKDEKEISDLKKTIIQLNSDLESLKKNNENNINSNNQDLEFLKKYNEKEEENNQLNIKISELKNKYELNVKNNNSNYEKTIETLKQEILLLNKDILDKNEQINKLNNAVLDFDKIIKESELELKKRNDIISKLQIEKEINEQKLINKENDLNLIHNNHLNEINVLKKQINFLDKIRNNLINDKAYNMDQINNLQKELNKYKQSVINIQENNNEKNESKIIQNLELKINVYKNEIERLNKQNENLISEYEKKIHVLNDSNNDLKERVNNLLNSLSELKDYSLFLEKNKKNNNVYYKNDNNIHNDNNNSLNNLNENSLNNENKNIIINSDNNNYNLDEYSKIMIQTMKNLIEKLDSKILDK